MSGIISFRLNINNPREEQALKVLKAWYEHGYSIRYTVTEALLRLNEHNPELISHSLDGLNEILTRISDFLREVEDVRVISVLQKQEFSSNSNLSDKFFASAKRSIKPGMRPD